MTAFKQQNAVAIAEGQSDALGKLSTLLDQAQWDLDAALSAQRKDAAGYRRANAANRDGGDSFDQDELDAAIRNARAILASCNPLQDLIARRAILAEQAAATAKAADPLAFDHVPLLRPATVAPRSFPKGWRRFLPQAFA